MMTGPAQPLEVKAGKLLVDRGKTLALAESCTGGLIAHRITNVAGSSVYFLGGIVSYSNEAKEKLLGVRHETLLTWGAVSEETAIEMADGARRRLGADIALSVTGIAGPSGATPGKPVGLTWIGFSTAGGHFARQFVWGNDREGNKLASSNAALEILIGYLESTGA
jgi:PncC family amidohydrolase